MGKIKILIFCLCIARGVIIAETSFSTNSYGCLFSIKELNTQYLPIEPILFHIRITNVSNDSLAITDNLDFNMIENITRNGKDVKVTSYV
jgi:hypothetical protein